MRIQYCVATLAAAGTERRCVLLANEAARRGHQVQLVVAQAGGALAELVSPAVEQVELGLPGRFLPRGLPPLARAVGAFRPQVFHGFTHVGSYYGALLARWRGVPAVVSSVGGLAETLAQSRLEGRLAPYLLRGAQVITVNSRGVAESFAGRWRGLRGRLELIPSCLELGDWGVPEAGRRAAVRRELGLGPEGLAVVTVGRLAAEKNHRDILAAAVRLAPRYPQVQWYWLGDGPLRAELSAEVAASGLRGRVHLLGLRTDVARLLQGMDLFVLPSAFEGMSNALLEALASGLPAVVSDVAGSRELVQPAGSGWLFPAGDREALAAVLERALSDPGQLPARGRAGRRLVARRYSLERVMDDYLALYRRLLARRRE